MLRQNIKIKIFQVLPVVVVGVSLVTGILYAWTEPTVAPPGNTVSAPLNVSSFGQLKSGTLSLGNLWVPNGRVGIGTLSPGYPLDVVGQIRIADGTQGAGKVLTSNASGVASWATGGGVSGITSVSGPGGSATGPVLTFNGAGVTQSGNTFTFSGGGGGGVGSGTPNKVIKWASSGTTLGDSQIFDNGTNVGIATVSPNALAKLDVNGPIRVNSVAIMGGAGGGTLYFPNSGGLANFYIRSADPTNWTSFQERMFISGTTGNVGIGTTDPAAKFVVSGLSSGKSIFMGQGAGTDVGLLIADSMTTGRTGSFFAGAGSVGINIASYNSGPIRFLTTASSDGSGFSERVTITNSGNVGIGTTNPGQKLSIGNPGNIEILNGQILVKTAYSGSTLQLLGRDIRTSNNENLYLNWDNASGDTIVIGGEGEKKGLYFAGPNGATGAGSYIDVPDVYIRSTGKWASQGGAMSDSYVGTCQVSGSNTCKCNAGEKIMLVQYTDDTGGGSRCGVNNQGTTSVTAFNGTDLGYCKFACFK